MTTPDDRITALLLDTGARPDGGAPLGELLPLVYAELHRMAQRRLRHERGAVTLSPTELVHEAYLRLAGADGVTARGRAYFFAAAAQAMRRIVVEYARSRGRLKRGGGQAALTLEDVEAVDQRGEADVLDIDDALDRLAAVAERPARVVECRFFGGLTVEETALALDITPRTVNRDWAFARAWLVDQLGHAGTAEPA